MFKQPLAYGLDFDQLFIRIFILMVLSLNFIGIMINIYSFIQKTQNHKTLIVATVLNVGYIGVLFVMLIALMSLLNFL